MPKSGSLNTPDNYRGISLTCIMAKIFNRLILNRIRKAIDPKLRYNQNGFRQKRSTAAQVLALRRIIEEVRNHNLTAVMTFIDFRKAFDSIHRGKMMKILAAYGVPPQLLRAIEVAYSKTSARVVTPDGLSDVFEILAGVLQGDTLAPFLFIIVLDYALRKALQDHEDLGFTLIPRRSRRVQAVKLSDLDFADDIALLSDDMEAAQQLLLQVEGECMKVGLHLNAKKTEVMLFNIGEHPPLLTTGGVRLEEVLDFKYLGSRMQGSELDIKVRKGMAWRALNDMSRIWASGMTKALKLRFFHATVETVLLYGCEAWTLTKALTKSLDGTYTRMLRKVQNISWRDHITNARLYGKIPAISEKIRERTMKLAGHCHRHPELPASQLITWEPTHGQRSRGGQRVTLLRTLMQHAGASSKEELATCMEDRAGWRARARGSRLRSASRRGSEST